MTYIKTFSRMFAPQSWLGVVRGANCTHAVRASSVDSLPYKFNQIISMNL